MTRVILYRAEAKPQVIPVSLDADGSHMTALQPDIRLWTFWLALDYILNR